MYSRKNVEPNIDPWGTQALAEHSCEDFPFSIQNFIKSLAYIKCYSLLSPRPVKSLSILSGTTVRSWVTEWVFIYELSRYEFESRCCHLYLDCFKSFKLNYGSKNNMRLFLNLATNKEYNKYHEHPIQNHYFNPEVLHNLKILLAVSGKLANSSAENLNYKSLFLLLTS